MSRPSFALITALVALVLGSACDRRGASPSDRPARARPVALAPVALRAADADVGLDWLPNDGAALEEPPAPLSGALAACVHRIGLGMPSELAAAVEAIGYPTIAEDACRLDLGVATHDPAMCTPISLTAMRVACLWRTAIVTGATDDCPASISDRGRDPVCVALASHNPGLCAAARSSERVRCLAVARLDDARCNAVDALLRPACHRDVAALRTHLAPRSEPVLPAGTAHLRVTIDPATDAGQIREYDLTILERGAYVTATRALWLVDPARGWPTELAASLFDRGPIVGFTVDVPLRVGDASVRDVRVILPDGLDFRPVTTSDAVGTAQFTQIGAARGRSVAGTLTASVVASGRPALVEFEFHTFIRDVVDAAELAPR